MKKHHLHKLQGLFGAGEFADTNVRGITTEAAGLSARLDARFGREPNPYRKYGKPVAAPAVVARGGKS